MAAIGSLKLDAAAPKHVVPLMAETIGDIITQSKEIKESTYELVDFKAEYFNGVTNLSQLWNALMTVSLQFPDDPLVFTLNSKKLPAEFMTEKDYYNTIHFVIKTALTDAVEVEDSHDADTIEEAVDYADEMGLTLLLSHTFTTPSITAGKIEQVLEKMAAYKAPIVWLKTPSISVETANLLDECIVKFKQAHSEIDVISDTAASPLCFADDTH